MTETISITLCVDSLEQEFGGIGRYTWELSQRLPQEVGSGSVQYFARNRLIDDPRRLRDGEPIYPGRALRRAARSWRTARALRKTLIHGPNYFLPRAAETGVITVHDLSVFRYPETHPAERVDQFERLFEDSVDRAAQIITDTETVRQELMETFGIAADRVSAVALGVSEVFRPAGPQMLAPILSRWKLQPGGYGLCVSAVEPRKKVSELLAAWRRLPGRLRDRFPLVLAGGSGWMNEKIHEQLDIAKSEGWLIHLGHVEEMLLARLYAGAALFVYPSAYEGFGLPPLEAMASGVPVIVSNRSCLPEVCGEAVAYVDPDNDNEFLTTIIKGLDNEQWRVEAVRRGLERAAQFTWKRCAEDTVAVYSRVLER